MFDLIRRILPRRPSAWLALAVLVAGVAWILPRLQRTAPSRLTKAAGRTPVAQSADRDRTEQDARAFEALRSATRDDRWVRPSLPIVPRGALSDWDDFAVTSPTLVVETKAGFLSRGTTRYRLWYRGCHLLGADYSCAVGYAESPDGVRWTKAPSPVFTPADRSDREHLRSVAVVRAASRFDLWYAVDPDWPAGHTHASLHHATSADGNAWHDDGVVLQSVDQDTQHHLLPAVLYDKGRYDMWYTDRAAPDSDRVIIHSTSADGRTWTSAGSTPLKPFGDQDPGRLSVIAMDGGYRAWFAYNAKRQTRGRMLGSCVSRDGSTWDDCTPVKGFPPPASGVTATFPIAHREGDTVWVIYGQHPANGAEEISLAARRGTL